MPLFEPTGGSNTQVQFNDAGALAGDAGLTYNKTTDALTIAGQLILSGAAAGQIVFPATQNASTNANTLDDYEEGTWTPVITFATPGDVSVTYSTQTGRYIKVGRIVQIWSQLTTSAFTHTTSSGALRVTGIPFGVDGAINQTLAFIYSNFDLTAGYTQVVACPEAANSHVIFWMEGDNVTKTQLSSGQHASGTNVDVWFAGVYLPGS